MSGKPADLQDLVKKINVGQADIMRSEILYCRSNDRSWGLLNWMYNDIWGCGTWSIIDKYFERKPAYFAQKRAFEPVLVNLTKESDGYYANFVNDASEPICGILKVEDKFFDGSVATSVEFECDIGAYSVKKFKLPSAIRSADYLVLQLGEYKAIYLQDDQSSAVYESDLTVKKERLNDNSIKVKIKANKFAKCVFVDIPWVVGDITDNYFDMEKGEERVITVVSQTELSKSDIKVLTFADLWGE